MSRMRQIPVMDAAQRERVISQSSPHPNPSGQNMPGQPMQTQPSQNQMIAAQGMPNSGMRPVAPGCRPRSRKAPANKMRLSDTPALLSTGCSSLREFCNGVQNITADLNNLIGSVESILPLLTTYLSMLQTRTMPEQTMADTPIDVPVPDRPTEPQTSAAQPMPSPVQHPNASAEANPHPMQQAAMSQQTAATPSSGAQSVPMQQMPMPRPEDLQQLLENPLVKNLMANFMQGTQR